MLVVIALPLMGDTTQAQKPEAGIVEKLGENLPLDVELYDEQGYLVPLGKLITKPTILTFVYYRCPGICSPLLTEVSVIVEKMNLEVGRDYQVLSISFDHTETPELAAEKRENYLASIERPIDPNGWRFLTGDSAAIAVLTDAAGFYFKREHDTFVHAGALIVVSPEGKITRYINGIRYLPFDVQMAVMEAAEGKVGPTIAKFLSFCYSYNPESRTYALNITRISALVVLVLVILFVVVVGVKPKQQRTT